MQTKYILTESALERFWSLVDQGTGDDDCWIWQGDCRHHYGYGSFWVNSLQASIPCHRLAWFLVNGEIPPDMLVCHDCPTGDNPRCCNPAHMFLGTYRDNAIDRERKGRHRHEPTWSGVGELNPKAKMTDAKVIEARRRYGQGGISQSELARQFGISQAMMNHIILGKHWKHLPSVDDLKDVA